MPHFGFLHSGLRACSAIVLAVAFTACGPLPSLQVDFGNAQVFGSGPNDLWVPVTVFGENSVSLLHSSGGAFSPVDAPALGRVEQFSWLESAGPGALWVWGRNTVEGVVFLKVKSDGTTEEIDTSTLAPEKENRSALVASSLASRGAHLFVVTEYSTAPRLWRRAGGVFEEIPLPEGTTDVQVPTATATGHFWAALRSGSDEQVVHRWDGSAWTAFPGHGADGYGMPKVMVAADDDVWFGTAHWDGTSWTPGISWQEFAPEDPSYGHEGPQVPSAGYIPLGGGLLGVVSNANTRNRPTENVAELWAWRWKPGSEPGEGRKLGNARTDCIHACTGGGVNYLADGSIAWSFDNGNGTYSDIVVVTRGQL